MGERGTLRAQMIDGDLHVDVYRSDGFPTVVSIWPSTTEMRLDGADSNGCSLAMITAAF